MTVRPSLEKHILEARFKTFPLGLLLVFGLVSLLIISFFFLDILFRYGWKAFALFLFSSIAIMRTTTFLHEKIHQKTFEAITGKSGNIYYKLLANSYFLPDSECTSPQYRIVALAPLIITSFLGLFTGIALSLSIPILFKRILLLTLLMSFLNSTSDLYVYVKLRKYNHNYLAKDTLSFIEVYQQRLDTE